MEDSGNVYYCFAGVAFASMSHISGGSRGVSLVSMETPFQIGINKIIYNHGLIN